MKISAHDAAQSLESNRAEFIQRRLTDEHELDIFFLSDPLSNFVGLEVRGLPVDIRLPPVEVGDVIDIEHFEQRRTMRLRLLSPDYTDVFFVLIDDLVGWTIAHPGLDLGARAMMSRLRRWERLLQASSRGLSLSAQKGLFGELHVVEQVAEALGIERAIHSWKGPEGGIRDFDLGGVAIEVKTTSGRGLLTVRISSEHQLEDELVNPLYLWCNAIEKVENGKTLNEMVDSVRSLASSNDELSYRLDEKLLCIGYAVADRARYSARFMLREECAYRVEAGFPRIVSKDVPDCVFDVSYSIDLEACGAWRLDTDSIWGNL